MAALFFPLVALASPAAGVASSSGKPLPAPERHFYIGQYRVIGGGRLIPRLDVETAVYPFLGPYRTQADVQSACAALEKTYHDAGFQTVTVQIPPQQVRGGVITLQVVPQAVGRLRVHGSRYFSIDRIKAQAPSLAEGTVPNFSQVARDLVGLNQNPDREVTPIPRAGAVPGTVDFDLNVKDTPPLHGSLELNNRYSAYTTPLRINGSVSYDNLWQLGHTAGASFQLSPEDINQVEVFSGFYLARVPGVDWLSLEVEGTEQNSNVSTLGGIGVAGRGQVFGLRAIFDLPQEKGFFQSLSLGADYKRFEDETQSIDGIVISDVPVTYVPLSAAYSGIWSGKGYETDSDLALNIDFRGPGQRPGGIQPGPVRIRRRLHLPARRSLAPARFAGGLPGLRQGAGPGRRQAADQQRAVQRRRHRHGARLSRVRGPRRQRRARLGRAAHAVAHQPAGQDGGRVALLSLRRRRRADDLRSVARAAGSFFAGQHRGRHALPIRQALQWLARSRRAAAARHPDPTLQPRS